MKKIILLMLAVFTLQTANAQHDQHGTALATVKNADIYTCPMHPEIQQGKPGKCPKCGMALVKKKPVAVKKQPVKKASPATKQPVPAKKETEKMDMGNAKTSDSKPSVEKSVSYTCPMHPEIHQNEPGKCPKCGMKLVPEKTKSGNKSHEGMGMSGSTSKTAMEGMDMNDNDATLANIKKAKANLGPIKTITNNTGPRTVRYDLYIADTTVTYGKKPRRAIAVNGQIPMPTLTFTEGDTAEIYVHNNLDEETSLHWHGLFLPNKEDGVPYMTQMPINHILPTYTGSQSYNMVRTGTIATLSFKSRSECTGRLS